MQSCSSAQSKLIKVKADQANISPNERNGHAILSQTCQTFLGDV